MIHEFTRTNKSKKDLNEPLTPLGGFEFQVSSTSPSSRRWLAQSRPANLPGGNGSLQQSPSSALATRGRSRDSHRRRAAHQDQPSRTAWAHRLSPASPRNRPRSQRRRQVLPQWGSAAPTSALAVAPLQDQRMVVGTPPSPRRRACAARPWAGSAPRKSCLAGPSSRQPRSAGPATLDAYSLSPSGPKTADAQSPPCRRCPSLPRGGGWPNRSRGPTPNHGPRE